MSETKIISDYLHYYIGGICREVNTRNEFTITSEIYCKIISGELKAKPVLFNFFTLPLSFWEQLIELEKNIDGCFLSNPVTLNFIFKNRYDFFGLTEIGLAFLDISTDSGKRMYKEGTFKWAIEPKPEWFLNASLNFCESAKNMKTPYLDELKKHYHSTALLD